MSDRARKLAEEIAAVAFVGEGNIHANDIVDEIRAYGDEREAEALDGAAKVIVADPSICASCAAYAESDLRSFKGMP